MFFYIKDCLKQDLFYIYLKDISSWKNILYSVPQTIKTLCVLQFYHLIIVSMKQILVLTLPLIQPLNPQCVNCDLHFRLCSHLTSC